MQVNSGWIDQLRTTMASYLKWWRKINADVNALAQDSSSSDSIEDNFNEVSESAGVHAEVPDEVRCLEAPQLASDFYLASVEVGPSSAGISDCNTCSSSDSEIDNSDQTTHSYSSSDYEIEESSNSGNTEIRSELAEWALKNNCTRKTVNDLLAFLVKLCACRMMMALYFSHYYIGLKSFKDQSILDRIASLP